MQTNTKKLDGKVAIVTGASKGIGTAIAKHLAAEGAAVVVNYSSSKEGADRVADEITKQGGKAVAVRVNMAKKAEVERLVSEAKKAFGRLDILVNNAGVYEFLPLENVTEEHFHKHFDVNVLGLLLAIQEATKYFGPEGGSVINISSSASMSAPPTASVYSATKAAVDTITKSLAKELGPRKIRVNSINPGMVETEGTHAGGFIGSDFEKQFVAHTPLGSIGPTGNNAKIAAFAAPDAAGRKTDATIPASAAHPAPPRTAAPRRSASASARRGAPPPNRFAPATRTPWTPSGRPAGQSSTPTWSAGRNPRPLTTISPFPASARGGVRLTGAWAPAATTTS